jgi:hypothetical protein
MTTLFSVLWSKLEFYSSAMSLRDMASSPSMPQARVAVHEMLSARGAIKSG